METETRYKADIKRQSFPIHYFKSLMVSIKIDFKKLYSLRPTKLDRNPVTEKISIHRYDFLAWTDGYEIK